jgi:hypothetical protein
MAVTILRIVTGPVLQRPLLMIAFGRLTLQGAGLPAGTGVGSNTLLSSRFGK